MKTKEQILQGSTVTIPYADFDELTKRADGGDRAKIELDSLQRRIVGGIQAQESIGSYDVICRSIIEIPKNCDDPWLSSIRARFLDLKRR